MKRILITGAESYIGTSFEEWLSRYANQYIIDTLAMKSDIWKEENFSNYDVIFHVAGIAHVSTKPKMAQLYFKINRDLAVETAKKAKKEGVKQFVFMSSIIVYGDIGRNTIIDKNTIPMPNNFYGKSKLEAEDTITTLEDANYKVSIIRSPMVYGKNSKGNYKKLARLAIHAPIFPDINNQRSMIYIDNLCEFIRLTIDNEESGIFFPQNKEYVNTSNMVKLISRLYSRTIIFTKFFNPLLNLLIPCNKTVHKVFGSLVYEKDMSRYKYNYNVRNFQESIELTEK